MSLFRPDRTERKSRSSATVEQYAAKRKANLERLGKPKEGGTTRPHSSQMDTKREHGEAAGDGIFSNKGKIRAEKIRTAAKEKRTNARKDRQAARKARQAARRKK